MPDNPNSRDAEYERDESVYNTSVLHLHSFGARSLANMLPHFNGSAEQIRLVGLAKPEAQLAFLNAVVAQNHLSSELYNDEIPGEPERVISNPLEFLARAVKLKSFTPA